MNAGDNSLVGCLLSATTLVGVNFLVGPFGRQGVPASEEVHAAILEKVNGEGKT